jgi:hypothetical protein
VYKLGVVLATTVLLAACGGEDRSGYASADAPGDGEPAAVDSSMLCVSSGCGERTVLLDIPGAENQLFTPEGRLFISSGSGVYEVTRDAEGAFAAALISADCGFTGLAQRGNLLYAVCGNGGLYAGEVTAVPVLTKIFQFEGMCIPNGTALGPDGNLYVVDEPLNISPPANCLPPDPKIVRLIVDPVDPMHILSQEVWVQGSPLGQLHLGLDNVLRFPNGLVRQGNHFFGTDGGSIYRVDLMPDGSAGEVMPLFFEATAHDDLGLAGDDALVVADFFGGRILLLSQDGTLLQETDRLLFSFPSSARLGRPPMFAPDDVLVTETGVLGDQSLPLDHLSVFRRSVP